MAARNRHEDDVKSDPSRLSSVRSHAHRCPHACRLPCPKPENRSNDKASHSSQRDEGGENTQTEKGMGGQPEEQKQHDQTLANPAWWPGSVPVGPERR